LTWDDFFVVILGQIENILLFKALNIYETKMKETTWNKCK